VNDKVFKMANQRTSQVFNQQYVLMLFIARLEINPQLPGDVTERALREIYLKPFQIAIKHSNPWALMTSYVQSVRDFSSC